MEVKTEVESKTHSSIATNCGWTLYLNCTTNCNSVLRLASNCPKGILSLTSNMKIVPGKGDNSSHNYSQQAVSDQ